VKSVPETLAIRAVNQYRRRDVVGYLGLRLYLDNTCAVRDRWAKEVASRLVLHDPCPRYHVSLHFKELKIGTGDIEYRRLCLPTPNEIVAETALLAECAGAGNAFLAPPSVYSYELATRGERRGVFVPYFTNFRKRHAGIAAEARRHSDGVVVYTDIRRFYPSISAEQAITAWRLAAFGRLPKWANELGEKLLHNYTQACELGREKGIVTGPMFSHLIANLVLRDIDEQISQLLPGGYFRYVDDIALVGSHSDVSNAEVKLRDLLKELNLSIREDKCFEVPASQWLHGEHDLADDRSNVSWKTFVGTMKQLIIARPELTQRVTDVLSQEGFRIRPLDYSDVVREHDYLTRLREWSARRWFRNIMHQTTPEELCAQARILRDRYQSEFYDLVNCASDLQGYERKRRVHQLRRYASRLLHLANPHELQTISSALSAIEEMRVHSVIFSAVATRDISALVQYGANAAHSVAPLLLSSGTRVACSVDRWEEPMRQARAIIAAFGLKIEDLPPSNLSDMEKFCSWVADGFEPDGYFAELACLHGLTESGRHQSLLGSAFDADEDMIVEIEDVLQQSY
jgi:hypothetical protein